MSNRLKNETSPYLLQHAENPVDWYPWCPEAFERARREDKPIFLSIGYSTCHWCHVMARESFEDPGIAARLNRSFISIKVDREERPDLDSVYLSVCQAFAGNAGWPMSIFMTWDKKPFYAGTYFPPRARYGSPGFPALLDAVEEQWRENRPALIEQADGLIERLRMPQGKAAEKDGEEHVQKALFWFRTAFDREWGGFGAAPKFPMAHNLLFLLYCASAMKDGEALVMTEKTLEQMRKGGIFDQIGGGFSRYSTDRYFLVPHFEKMLYDNAFLIMAYCAAWQMTGKKPYRDTAERTADYVLREMTDREGGFYSAQDADSDGVEGKFYTLTKQEILHVLGRRAGGRFAAAFDITAEGNFEGSNVPNLLKSEAAAEDFADEMQTLRAYRRSRGKLHLDDKILTGWNAMMIAALCMLFRACGDPRYLNAAIRAQSFLDRNLFVNGKLYASFRDGKRSDRGFLDDYAFEIAAHLELYHSTLERDHLERAQRLSEEVQRRFADRENGGFFLSEQAELFLNPKEIYDGALPSANSIMAYNFVRIAQLTNSAEDRALAEKQLSFLSAHGSPQGQGMGLLAKLLYEMPPQHIVCVYQSEKDVEAWKKHLPFFASIVVQQESGEYPLLNGQTTWYVCRGTRCLPPSNTPPAVRK